MPLKARVARTAHDLQHVNKLRIPAVGVSELKLQMPGGAESKVYLPDTPEAKKHPPPKGGSDDVHFAPEKEKVKIVYKIVDPLGALQKARLELFGRFSEKPLWTRDLEPDERKDGEHTLEWDGKVAKSADFPDEYITVQFSPYKLKLSVGAEPRGDPSDAFTYFHVLVAEVELSLGDKAVLKEARDKEVYASVEKAGGLPAEGKKREVNLVSNIFKTGDGQMYDNTAFDEYKKAWADGPLIPVFAKVWLKDSAGKKVEAPKALGNTKFLWDWEDVAEDTSRHHAKAKDFLDAALDYSKSATKPKGDNCHLDRGGKRGEGAAAVFPVSPGYAPADALDPGKFPFKVEACKTRKWAAYSYGWGHGKLAGHTGVLISPSRMAGDAVKVSVQVAYDVKADGSVVLDVTDDAPLNAAVRKATGTFELWRELHFVKYVKKKAALPGIAVATFQDYYEKANIRVIYKAGAAVPMGSADYNAKVAAAVATLAAYARPAIDPATDQHAGGDLAVTFRTYAQYKTALMAAFGWSAADLATWFIGAGSALNSSTKYHGFCSSWAMDIVTKACDGYLHADKGINLLQFQGLYNLEAQPGGSQLNGFAANFASAGRNKCAFVLCAAAGNYGGDSNTREQTVTHEIGHHLFLAHATDGVSAGAGPDATAHDNAWHNCMMSYHYDQERKFCGLCILKLRGWDKTKLDPTAANNRKA